MVESIPSPNPHRLLPPLLACLPTAFASHRPPPALLPLVSPILRQRLQLLTSASSSENWLRLLCWDEEKAETLKDVVANSTYEPHPTSGEIEIGEIGAIMYKRLDQDTLRAQVVLSEWSLAALYLWCSANEEESGWKLAELLPHDLELQHDPTWSPSIAEANETSRERILSEALRDAEAADRSMVSQKDDDDYWAQYDKIPDTPPTQDNPPLLDGEAADKGMGHSDADYYARYGQVQPALDNHDLSEESNEARSSSLQGDLLANIARRQLRAGEESVTVKSKDIQLPAHPADFEQTPPNQPQLSTPSTNAGNPVRLREGADQQPSLDIGIRQHISSSLKSLYSLARSAGMRRDEFNSIVQQELQSSSRVD